IGYAEGFDLADANTVTVRSLYKEWAGEQMENYHIPSGYGSLIRYIAEECKKNGGDIITDTTVNKIKWASNKVSVSCNNGMVYDGVKIIVTTPVSMYRQDAKGAIEFAPEIPGYISAANHIGWGYVIK